MATPALEVLAILDREVDSIQAPVAVSIPVQAAVFIMDRAEACIPAPEGACILDRAVDSTTAKAEAFTREAPQQVPARIKARSVPASQAQQTTVGWLPTVPTAPIDGNGGSRPDSPPEITLPVTTGIMPV